MNHLMVQSILEYFTKKFRKSKERKCEQSCGHQNDSHHHDLFSASEQVYSDYYKLKGRYEAENREKSSALTRVDQVIN